MTIDDVHQELADVRRELNSPKLSLFRARALYRRLGELYAIIDKLEEREHAA